MAMISKVIETLVSWAKKMPPIYKFLADFLAWSLFITAVVTLFSTVEIGTRSGELYNMTNTAPVKYAAFFVAFAVLAVSAVVVMLLTQKIK